MLLLNLITCFNTSSAKEIFIEANLTHFSLPRMKQECFKWEKINICCFLHHTFFAKKKKKKSEVLKPWLKTFMTTLNKSSL